MKDTALRFFLFAGTLVLSLGYLGLPSAEAVQIKKIYTGQATFDNAVDLVQSVPIGGTVDPTKSIILISPTVDASTRDQNNFFMAQFEDNGTINIQRGGVTIYAAVIWQVIEFTDGVSVQRGLSSLQSGQLTKSITLPNTLGNASHAVPIVQTQSAETSSTRTSDFFFAPTIPNAQTLTLTRGTASSTKTMSLTWQVIEFLYDANVYTGLVRLPVPGSAATNQTATNNGVNPNSGAFSPALSNGGANAIMLFYPEPGNGFAGGGQDAEFYTRGTITNNTTVTFMRQYAPTTANTNVDVQYYVVDFTDGTTALGLGQSGAITGKHTTTLPANVNISSSTDATPIQITTSAAHGLSTGQLVNVSNHATNVNADGDWVVTVQNSTQFTLNGTTATGAGAGGATGTIMPAVATTLGTAVTTGRSIVLVSADGENGATGLTSTSLSDDLSVAGLLTNSTTLSTIRDSGGKAANADLNYFVYEFPPLTVRVPNGGELWHVGDTQNITWKHSADLESGGTCGGGAGPGHKLKIELSVNSGSTYLATPITSDVCANLDTYAWTIPASISATDVDVSTARIKLTDQDLAARNTDVSNADFTIKGTLTITQPNTNLTWFVGDTNRTITWTKTGNMDDNGSGATQGKVQLLLYKNSGATFDSNITPGTGTGDPLSSALTYAWNPIPDKIGTGWRVKIQHLADTAGINDLSDVDFTIKGTLTVTYPNGGETLLTQNAYNITWNKTGTFPAPGGACTQTDRVDLYYSTNSGGTFPNLIASCQPAGTTSGSYSWTVPSTAVGSFSRVRVQQAGDATVFDDSNADFSILASISITSPTNGTEVWGVGTTQNITWTINGVGITNVKIEYSSDGGTTYNITPIVASTPAAAGTYPWVIPDALSNQTRVRISDAANPSVSAVSANNFAIKGRVHVLAPNGGEVWPVGSSQVIQWEKFGTITGNADIRYSTDGGATYPNLLSSTTLVTALSYTWNSIPDTISTTVKVKVDLASDPSGVWDDSDTNFAIKGSLTLTAPTGGQSFTVGSSQTISWTKTGSIGSVALYYSTDGGTSFPAGNLIASGLDPVTGTPYAWTVPDNISSTVRVKVQLVADATVFSISSSNLAIKGSLTLTAPVGGEVWKVGETNRNITWTRVGTTGNMTGNVKLEYSTDGGLTYPNLINNTTLTSALSYTWNPIPDAIGTTLRVKITLLSDTTVNNTSPANFTIKGQLVVTAPNGAETWIVGNSQNITWTTNGTIAQAKLCYSTDGGVTYPGGATCGASPNITGAISNVGAYSWTIPDAIGTQVRVRVENASDSTVAGQSAANFTIKGSLTVTAPNGGETWIVGASQNITWTKTGTLSGNVKLIYSTDGGATYPDPANVITSTTLVTALSYAWTVPDAIGNTARVRIVYLNDTTVTDDSNANFAIKGSLTITAPNGGEVWAAGTTQNITWTKTGTLGAVKLEYSTDGGVTYPNLITGSVSATPTTYAWTIPAGTPLTTTGRIKITLLSDTTVADASDNNFRLRGNVTLTSPNGGETWIVSNTKNITWTIAGAITNVKLEYSKNAFTDELQTFSVIASTPAAGLSYAWVIPDAIGTNLKVRVSDTNDATTNSISAAPFTIKGSVTITAPNGGETWIVGTTQNITWTMTGSLGNVKLEYSTDGGTTWPVSNLITASTTADTPPVGDNAGSYAWLIPDAIGASVKVRVSQATDSTVNSISALNFTIKGSLAISAPNGSEGWPINSVQTITWTKTGTLIGNLKLEYSTDGGLTYPVANLISNTVLATSTSYAWTVPDNPTTQARVRITYLNDTTVSTVSVANFSIKGSLFITAPNGGEVWVVGQSRNITWTRGGSIANAKLDYSTDGGATYPNSITLSTPAANLSYTWTIPDSISNTVRVRIMDANDSTVNSASAANFAIKGSLALTTPNGGETWIVNSVQNITWTKTGTIPNVKLEYSKNGFLDELQTVLIAASTPGSALSYAWTIPDAIGTALKVRITNVSDATVLNVSGASFTIKGSLTLTSPVGGETWIVNSAHNVTWTKQGSIANVKLEYSKNGFLDELQTFVITASAPAAPLSYAWTVPDAIGTTVKVRVSDASDATVNSRSGANFTIKGSLTVTAPNGGEVWTVLSSRNITWTKVGSIVNVQLQYSTDGGSTFPNTITTSTDASLGTYAWTIPDAIGALVKVRVTNTADTSVFDDSDANFKIVGVLAVTTPVGGEKWTVGSVQTITWTRTGSISNVKLEYSTDSGVTYPNLIIATTPATALSYSWTVPNSPSATARVKVSDVTDATVYGISPADFKIKAGLTVTAPTGGEVWTVSSPQSITWTTVGTAANVKLEYSTDGGLTYPNLITASTLNTGSYSWTVPDAISTSARVKVTNTADVDSFSASAANFKIRGALTITAPNGGEGWPINTTQTITWTRTGSISNVKLEYSTDGGTTYPNVITASTSAVLGTYAWLIPDAPSATARVRVSDASDATVNAASGANFSIKGSLTVTAPNGGEVWVVGSARNITWTKFGSIANVKLEYSTDGGVTYPVGNLIIASTAAATLSYSWTIPDAIGTQLRVRISDAGDATVNAQSAANFSIKGSISLTSPIGGETWIVGATQNITWTKTGSFPNVKLEYSTNGFLDELQTVLITASTPNTLTFAWTIPDAIGTTVKVRASDAANATVVSSSATNFTIKGSLAMVSPNGGEVWRVGESRNITWTKTGTIANVKLEYSTDGGATYSNVIIASTAAAAGSYTWTVPDAIGTNRRVRVTNTADATVSASSAANFEIKGQVTVTAPNGGEVWTVGSSRNITWTKQGTFSTVKLEYSTNAFANELQTTVIALSVDAVLGTPYAWTVPDAIGTSVRVRITNNADAAVFDVSDANFKIAGSLTLASPVGGESWTVSSSQNITWTKVGSIANVKLEYSTDGGTTYPNIITASTAAGTGAYAWTIPDAIGTTRRVRISDASDATVFAASAANFKILGGFTLTAPNGGEVWTVGSSQNITWTTAGTVTNVKLEYSTDGGVTYPNLIIASTANTSTYAWTVPDAISTTVKVRISDASDATAFKVSAANFKIRGSLLLTAPNGGEAWPINSSKNITWTKTGSIANVKLEYSLDGGVTYPNLIIASTAASTLSYAWTIPNAPSTTVRVRITDVSDSTVSATSAGNFKIQGVLTLTSPVGSEAWIVGSSYNITWTLFGAITNVKIQYSTDGGTTWPDPGKVITALTAAAPLSYTWTIPDDISATVKVRISDTGDPSVFATSAANFNIKGSLTVTAPVGGETWVVASSKNITWTKTGTIPNVKLEYSTDGGVTYPNLITASVLSTPSTYAWTIPDAISATVKVRVSNVTDATVNATSPANFSIKGSLTVNAPNGGETWVVGSSQPITWSKVGSIANVKLEYSTDGGVTYPNLIVASTPASAGSYSWTIPDAITTTARVRVTDASDAAVFATSAANFKIAGSLTVTAPAGGEAWLISTTQNIIWTKTGSIANVKLEYSTDGGVTYPNLIVASVSASTGTPYAWVIPDTPTTTAKVRVTNTADASVFATSTANFNIRGSVTLTAPNGGQIWVVGATQNITWTKTGSFPNVKLEYSTDGGVTYPNLITASTLASALTYAWTIPDAISTTVKVKITQTDDSAVTSSSAANFTIKGSINLTAPNGAEVWVVGATQNVTWTKTGSIANVKLEYSTDGGVTYPNVITASAPAAPLSYAWTIPDAIGTQLRVRVTNTADATVTASSAANFTIKGSLTLNAPNGGEIWIVGATQNITWGKTGTIANVKLEYSTDSGLTYPNLIIASTLASALSYAWVIPDTISSTVRVKITNLVDTTVFATSAANFSIKGSLTLTVPVGGEVWVVGATQNITWAKTGSIATAKLEYSTDGGVTYPNIITTSVAASALTFAWTVPDNMSSTVKVKITNTADATVSSASAANFKIAGSFTLTSPVGGEKWAAGSTHSISWTKTGSIVNAKLEYSTDGGLTYPNLIVATVPAANLSYAWTLGSMTSTQVRVRISDVSDATVFATSAANFKIMGGFTLTTPNGGEVWVVGNSQNITWTTVGNVANVKLSYSVDGGTTFPNVITASTANTGSYAWIIPDAIGTTLRAKIEDVLDVDAFTTSAANFKIKGSLTVTAPNGGEIWSVASVRTITWTKTGSIANIKIEYSTDGGTTYPVGNLIAASVAASLGTYAWTIPDSISTTVKVRLTDVTDATVTGVSSANFTIRGSFTLTAPNGGEKWKVGSTQSITWTTFGTIPNVKLEYSTDGGVTYPNVIVASTANAGTYSWSIPNAISATCRIRVSNAADPGTLATSATNFKILAGFTVTAPAGGEVWVVGASQSLTWTTAGTVANVKLEYSTDGGVTYPVGNLISASSPNTGTFAWTVPNAISATLRVRVSDATDTIDAFGVSAANFKIRAGFTLTAPAGGEAWTVSTTKNITWTTAGTVANVKLEYSTDGGTTYPNVIAASIANAGTYTWVIPDAITTAAKVRVSDINDITANAISGTNFKIQGYLSITAPIGGETWKVGSVQTITWNRAGSIGFVKLEFSTNGGALYAPITASTSNTGSYAWTIPDNISTNCLVKVSDTNDATVNSVSAAVFKIQAGFTVTAPAGGEVWAVGSARTITWTTNGTVSFVKIDYSTDGGTSYPNLITSSTSNTGTYAWTVPDNVSGTVRVRVSQTTDAAAFGTSAGNFRIRATFVMVSPNGAEQWRVGQVQNVTWTVTGTIPNVQLQYSRDGFTVDVQTISASAPNTATYAWTIPDAISNTVKVRVSDPNDIGAFATSGANFRITGNFTVTAPNGGEQWIVGTTQNITWTKTGTVANAKIEYSTDAGGTWTTIAGLAPNNGLFAWTIPDTITALGRVRVSDPNDATANAISAANFKIKAGFTLTAPVGGEVWTVGQSKNITWTNTGTVANVKLSYSTDGGTTYPNTIIASVANIGTYVWTVPDAISTTVRIKAESTTDIDAFATSPANFKIRGALTLTAPNGGEGFKIANTHTIAWTTTGTIPNVKLTYSTDGGVTYPNVITASVGNANSYAWVVPDAPTTTARVRIENVSDSTVFTTSAANFSIQGNFTITSPNGGEIWTVNEIRNITWNWGGTIPNVKLSYSTDGGVTYLNVITLSTPNGIGSSGSFSYAWTVPNSISTTVRVKIENVTDAATFDTSDANFKIQGKLVVVTPNGSERWVVNETRSITWTTTGTIPNVKLEYSTDSGATYPVGNVIAASVLNTGTYNWVIPNNLSTTARVRVSNTADATVSSQSAADFKIDLYTITFQVKDLLTNNNLDQLSVNATNTSFAGFTWAQSGLTSPITKSLAYGNWQTTFTRVSYGDQTVNFVAGSDQTIQVFMETQVVHIWEAVTELAYNTNNDTVAISSTLRRDGSTVTGAVGCTVKFYDTGTLIKTFTNSGGPDAQGFYAFTWTSPTGLVTGKVYNVVTTINIATGGVFNTPRTFSVTDVKKLQDVQDTVNAKLDTPLSQVKSDVTTAVQTKLDAQTSSLNTKLDTQTANINTKLDTQTGLIQNTLNDFTSKVSNSIISLESAAQRSDLSAKKLEDAAVKSQAAAENLKKTGEKFSARLLIPPTALVGETVTLRYRAKEKLLPLMDIFTLDKDGKTITIRSAIPMAESSTAPGLYEYAIKVATESGFTPGKPFTVFVQEATTGNLEAGSVFVESTSLSSLEGLIASGSGMKPLIQQTFDAISAVKGTLATGGDVTSSLELLKTKVDRIPRLVAQEGGTVQMRKTVNDVAQTIKQLAGDQGYDFSQLVKKGVEEAPSLKSVRKKTDEIQGATEVMQILMEQKLGGKDDPVVHVTYE